MWLRFAAKLPVSKAQQSKSKSAFRGFVGYTAKVSLFYSGQQITDEVEMQSVLNDAKIAIEDTKTEIYDAVLFSNTRNIDLWEQRFNERLDETLDKIRAALQEQLDRKMDEDEKAFAEEARRFGTTPTIFAQFLALAVQYNRSVNPETDERKTAYVNLQDVINVFTKIAFAVKNVRYDGRFYHVSVAASGGGRRKSRRTRRKKKTSKTVRF